MVEDANVVRDLDIAGYAGIIVGRSLCVGPRVYLSEVLFFCARQPR